MSGEPGAAARAAAALRQPRRSAGLKLLLVCVLAVLMSIPALFVFLLLNDRTHRAEEVTREISAVVGGPQTFLGPVVAVPYAIPAADPKQAPERDVFVIFPITGEAQVDAKSEVRRRSLFKVPVYQADLAFKAHFDLTGSAARAPVGAALDWSRAELVAAASDARGARSDITLTAAGRTLPVAPAATFSQIALKGDDNSPSPAGLTFFGAPAAEVVRPDAVFDATARMRFSGAQRLAVLAFAKTTTVSARSDWANPSFDGGFLPDPGRRTIGPQGFTAAWSVPFIARGVPAQGASETLGRLGQTAMGVSFVEPANPYRSVARSLKYALMFVSLVFLAYFLFETLSGKRVHPAQYLLVGLAQVIFYLLLLSIAERIGFDGGFAVAAVATVGLISAYAGWVFERWKQGIIALIAFSLLYALIYVLMRLEDFALLVGAVTSFAAVAAVMYFTRRIDWYGSRDPAAAPDL
ncbi:cell envelope integrity protein CreD [Phenylobacterium sp.]|uniref:cell envelope integrity protein CreD n=1 Tax=Phenylobacterium sp. TaxID=1871053 RepID=UPI002F3F752E